MQLTLGQLDFFRAVERNQADPARLFLRVDLTAGVAESDVDAIATYVEHLVARHPALAYVIDKSGPRPGQSVHSHARDRWLRQYSSFREVETASQSITIDPFAGPSFICRVWATEVGFEADLLVSHYFIDMYGTGLLAQEFSSLRNGQEMEPPVGVAQIIENEQSSRGVSKLAKNAAFCESQLLAADPSWLIRPLGGLGSEGSVTDPQLAVALASTSTVLAQPVSSVLLLAFSIAMLPECAEGSAMIKSLYGGSRVRRAHISPYCFNAYVGFALDLDTSVEHQLAEISRKSLSAYSHAWYDTDEVEEIRGRRAAQLGAARIAGDVYFNYVSPITPEIVNGGERLVEGIALGVPLPYRASLDVVGFPGGAKLIVRGAGWRHYTDARECALALAAILEALSNVRGDDILRNLLSDELGMVTSA